MAKTKLLNNLKKDIPASVVVFFVALPLCLGIAIASGAPPFSGLIAGIVGGIIVGSLSGSRIGVSGPAAGLAAIVFQEIEDLGSFEIFLMAVVIGGVMQIIFGLLKAGIIGYYFPSAVIKGMLSGIGIFIILKEIPHFLGYDKNPLGDSGFFQMDGETTFSEITKALNFIEPGALIIGIIALIVLIIWHQYLSKQGGFFNLVQGPLVVVVLGVLFYLITKGTSLEIASSHLVNVPIPESFDGFVGQFRFPDFEVGITKYKIWLVAFTIALVASLETLLCVEATDKLDPEKNVTPTNRELIAQGVGNICSGMIGGLPITQVIVRSSANIQSGAKSKLSAIIHGFLLLISVITIPFILNMIPYSVLAAILFMVGYKLAKPALFKKMYKLGWYQFLPFIVTILGIIFTDLLIGITIGLAVGIIVVLIKSYENSHFLHKETKDEQHLVKMTLAEEVTFLNKGAILNELNQLEENSKVEIDVRKTRFLDYDILEVIDDFAHHARLKNINVKVISKRGIFENPDNLVEIFKKKTLVKE